MHIKANTELSIHVSRLLLFQTLIVLRVNTTKKKSVSKASCRPHHLQAYILQ